MTASDGEPQTGAGETTQSASADQFDDPGVREILRLAEAENARAIARRRRRLRQRAFALLAVVLALSSVAAFRVGFEADNKRTSLPDFVWPAQKRADHYRIEFLLGARVVHIASTNVPRLPVKATKLPPGRYRWRVWALDNSGARMGGAIVDTSVTLR